MIVSDIAGIRRLYETKPRNFYRGVVRIVPDRDVLLPPFTGKVVKSLLIKANPTMEEIFGGKYHPKPIHVSTLVRVDGGRRTYLWKKAGGKKEITMRLGIGQEALFYIGFTEDVAHKVFDAIASIDGVEVFHAKWALVEYSIEAIKLPTEEPPAEYSLDNAEAIVVEFRTPVLLLDPYKESRFKRFLPLPGITFSYNIGDLLRMERSREYMETVDLVNALLNETYSALETVKSVMYIYEGRQYPGLIGYIKYMIDWDIVGKTGAKTFLENILVHASIMGIGTSRANGFGHTTIKIIEKEE